ncbi:MAG: imidazole glycerol phosphate synthase subunit HisH [Propionibacterium sp.]|nr:MAG: imidazole glycerol phosphate synthase subunit HisH [Propionibacterium sp.]
MGLLDYGSGNLHSAARALTNIGGEVFLGVNKAELWHADALVVPGVGAFAACMAGLSAIGGTELITDWYAAGRPLLGICVGHQILFEGGDEHGVQTSGVGIYPGSVTKLPTSRLPHMGWSKVTPKESSLLFKGVEEDFFYFVHSYAALNVAELGETTCNYLDISFVAAVEKDYVTSTQFHPEKSGKAGHELLRNWLESIKKL